MSFYANCIFIALLMLCQLNVLIASVKYDFAKVHLMCPIKGMDPYQLNNSISIPLFSST